MKVAIIGYGKMGQAVEGILIERGHAVTHKFNKSDDWTSADLHSADVAIEFTQPDAAANNLLKCIEGGIPVVTGTTGWMNELSNLESAVEKHHGCLFYASNFSIGVAVFNSIIRAAARKLNHLPEYQAAIREIHHLEKKDAPSGTAITLAQTMLSELDAYHDWRLDETREGVLPITAIREGAVRGTHEITFTGAIDRITLTHEAFSREGFARGAVTAAEWVLDKRGVFTMNDLLNLINE